MVLKTTTREFPGGPVVRTPCFQSLVGELRSCRLHVKAKKKIIFSTSEPLCWLSRSCDSFSWAHSLHAPGCGMIQDGPICLSGGWLGLWVGDIHSFLCGLSSRRAEVSCMVVAATQGADSDEKALIKPLPTLHWTKQVT